MRRLSEIRAHMHQKRSVKRRQRLAHALELSAVPERPLYGRGPRYLVHPTVTVACAPALRAMAAALRKDTFVLDEEEARVVWAFIRIADSPLFSRDIAAAESEAQRLRDLVLGIRTVAVDDTSLALAV